MHFEIKSIQDIPDHLYEGYYWYSDSQPEVIINERIDKNKFTKMPFVVEANFFSKEEEVSIQVRNIDGHYHISGFRLKGLKDSNKHVFREYMAHDLKIGEDKAITKFKMVEAWEEASDPLLENMITLQPSWAAFRGFII